MTRLPRPRRIRLALAALLFLGLGYITVERAALKEVKRTDFTVYLAAAGSVLQGGEDLYQVTNERGWHYTMPPPFAILFAPFALVPPWLASALWYALTIALLCLALSQTGRAIGADAERRSRAWWLLPVLLCVDPLLDTITRSQLGILMLACCVAALSLLRGGRSFAAGLLVAFATTIKVYSGLLVLFFLQRRDWRALLGCAVSALGLGLALPACVFGPRLTIEHWQYWLTHVVLPFAQPTGVLPFDELQDPMIAKNQSLYGTLCHLVSMARGGDESGIAAEMWIKCVAAAVILILLVSMLIAWRTAGGAARDRELLLQWSLPLMLGLLALPTAWSHYYSMLLLPLAALQSLLAVDLPDHVRRLARRTLIAFGCLSGLYALSSVVRPVCPRGSLALQIAMVPRSAGLFCFATLVLFGAFLYLLICAPQALRDRHAANAKGSETIGSAHAETRITTLPK